MIFDNVEPSARKSDPLTSHQAADSMLDNAITQRDLFLYAFLRANGSPLTSENAYDFAKKLGLAISPRSYWKRVSELAKMGYISVTGTRMGSSGRQMQAYVITEAGKSVAKVKGYK